MKKGFTLIELLAVIVILAVIALIATPIILGIIEDTKKQSFKDSAFGINQAAKNAYVSIMYAGEDPKDITYTYVNGVESSEPEGYNLNFEGAKPNNGQISLTKEGKVALAVHDGKYCATKGYDVAEVTIEEKAWEECNIPGSVIVDQSGANAPVLATGMTPVIWNDTSWVTATNIDDLYKQNWYDYDLDSNKWANAKTADGSMWVWIPRYVYKISSGWHLNNTGTIDVQFSQGTNDNWNSAVIGAIDTDTTSNASNNKWTNHPGFTFGTTELTGIWVAKFEATAIEGVANGYTSDELCPMVGDDVTTKTIKVIPNVASWRCISAGNMFTNIRNMETKAVYGWTVSSGLQANGNFTTDTNNLNTHLMKNIEWGAVAYLSKSQYGRYTEEIYINNNQNYITGCAGNTVAEGAYNGCQNSYESIGGLQASTTGNIYGIYDLSGGAWEKISAYVDNASVNLANQGLSIINADSKYKDVYAKNTTDNNANNYLLTVNKKGDAVWETSSNGINTQLGWFSDYTNMPNVNNPWFMRGSRFISGSGAGIFAFGLTHGSPISSSGFRPVLVVGTGL